MLRIILRCGLSHILQRVLGADSVRLDFVGSTSIQLIFLITGFVMPVPAGSIFEPSPFPFGLLSVALRSTVTCFLITFVPL